MKHPKEKSNNEESSPVTHEDVMAAQSRAIRAQQEALDLRKKLEGLENLLAKTKETLAATNNCIEQKDKEIVKVQMEAKTLSGSIHGLEERFQKLCILQNELHEKRKELGLDEPIRPIDQPLESVEKSESEMNSEQPKDA